jgi:predicted amidohydrolase YtcJ
MRTISLVICIIVYTQAAMAQWNPYADTIFTGGSVVTVDKAFSIHKGLAVKDGRVMAVGTADEVLRYRGADTKVIDLKGRTIIPGIQDSHIHFVPLGNEIAKGVELTYAKNASDILAAVQAAKERNHLKPGEWLNGYRWDQYKYPEMVTRWQLDTITPDNPVRLSRVYRGVAVNTKVFKLMGIDDERPETWPAWWLKNPENFTFEDKIVRQSASLTINGRKQFVNVPTGVFLGTIASGLVRAVPPPATFEDNVESVRLGVKELLRLGVTSIVDPASQMGQNMRIYQAARNRGYLDLRIAAVYEGIFFRETPKQIHDHFEGIKINNLGDSFLRWRGVKFYADGGTGARSSWLSEPFELWKEYEGKPNYGVPVMPDSAFRESQFRAALDYGWELHTHNTGDQAMRQTMDLYMKLLDEIRAKNPSADPRWSIIHAYFPIEPKTRVLEGMGRYKVMATTNPMFVWQLGSSFVKNTGDERVERLQPFRTYSKSNVIMAAGSDFGVATHNPWMGFYAMLTRKDQTTGKVLGPEETVGIEYTLRAFTWNGAYLTHEENFKGSLEVGKAADLVVLNIPDIYALERTPELAFEMDKRVDMTMVEGRIVFQANQ